MKEVMALRYDEEPYYDRLKFLLTSELLDLEETLPSIDAMHLKVRYDFSNQVNLDASFEESNSVVEDEPKAKIIRIEQPKFSKLINLV